MGYDNDDELNAREQRQEWAEERRRPIGHVLYWKARGRPMDGSSPVVVLALISHNDLDDYFLAMSIYLKQFTKRPRIRWPPNSSDGLFVNVTSDNLRELETEIIANHLRPGERIKSNNKAVIIALFDFKEDPANLIIVMGLVPFKQKGEMISRIKEKKPRLVYEAYWLKQDFVESIERWALEA